MKIVIKTTIQQAQPVVFAYISNPMNEPHWNADLVAVEGADDANWGVGSTCTMLFGASPQDRITITVTDLVPNQHYSFKSDYATSTYMVRGNAERTRIVFETDVVVRGVMLQTVKRAALKRSLEERLEQNFMRLKEVLENPTLTEGYADDVG